MLTPAEVAKRLNVSVDFVYKRLRAGEISAHKFGHAHSSSWRIPEYELAAFLRRSAKTDEHTVVDKYFGAGPRPGRRR